jgi:predicted HAD superfamily Cof-like phosphohydrolase
MLDLMHYRKIELSEAICVINPGGYVGESTASEIKYALKQDCDLFALERNDALSKSLFTDVLELVGGIVPPIDDFIQEGPQKTNPPDWLNVFRDELNVFRDEQVFMEAMGQTVAAPNQSQTELYLKLMIEELFEALRAAYPGVGTSLQVREEQLLNTITGLRLHSLDEVALFDALQDILVVTINCGLSRAYPMAEGWREVLRSNMAKIDLVTGKVKKRADGKVLKPEGWTPPDLRGILEKHWSFGLQPEIQAAPEVPEVVSGGSFQLYDPKLMPEKDGTPPSAGDDEIPF